MIDPLQDKCKHAKTNYRSFPPKKYKKSQPFCQAIVVLPITIRNRFIETQLDRRLKESSQKDSAYEVTTEVVYLIKDAYDFLTKIAWTDQEKADEIGRIARAAFGPIGAFIGAQLSLSSAQNNKSPASN